MAMFIFAAVAFTVHPDVAKRDRYLAHEMAIADQLEGTP
jgi:hypothetical protein